MIFCSRGKATDEKSEPYRENTRARVPTENAPFKTALTFFLYRVFCSYCRSFGKKKKRCSDISEFVQECDFDKMSLNLHLAPKTRFLIQRSYEHFELSHKSLQTRDGAELVEELTRKVWEASAAHVHDLHISVGGVSMT